MGKSLGNFINLDELFTGSHKLLAQAYSPMTIRFFILQAHYRSTLDFSNEGLQAAEKAMARIFNAVSLIDNLPVSEKTDYDIAQFKTDFYTALNDDLNTAIALSHVFDAVRYINTVHAGGAGITAADKITLKELIHLFIFDLLGLKEEGKDDSGSEDNLMQLLLSIRAEAKSKKDFATSDKIRDELLKLNYVIKDDKNGTTWNKN